MKKKHQQQQQQKSYQCMRTIQSINLDRNLSKRINNNKNKGLISFYHYLHMQMYRLNE